MTGPALPIPVAKDPAWNAGRKAGGAAGEDAQRLFQMLIEEFAGGSGVPAEAAAEKGEGRRPGLGGLLRATAWPMPARAGDAAASAETEAEAPSELVVEEGTLAERLAERIVEAMPAPAAAAAAVPRAAGHAAAPATPEAVPARSRPRAEAPQEFPGTGQQLRAEPSPAGAMQPRVTHRETHFAPAEPAVPEPARPAAAADPAMARPVAKGRGEAGRGTELAPAATPDPEAAGKEATQPDFAATAAARRGPAELPEARPAAEPARAAETAAASRPQAPAAPVKVLHLHLQPAELGELTVKLRLTDAGLEVHLEATRHETVTLLRNDREALTGLLKASGYAPEAVTIVMADRSAAPQGTAAEGGARQGDWQQGASGEAEGRGGRSDGRAQSGGRGQSEGTGHEQDKDGGAARRPGDLYL